MELSDQELVYLNDSTMFPKSQLLLEAVERKLFVIAKEIKLHKFYGMIPFDGSDEIKKVSKGSNYLGQPYRVLDFPAKFHKEGNFALRTIFIWGYGFTSNLLISSKYKSFLRPEWYKISPSKEYYIQTTGDPWKHYIENRSSELEDIDSFREIGKLEDLDFIKISKFDPISLVMSNKFSIVPFLESVMELLK